MKTTLLALALCFVPSLAHAECERSESSPRLIAAAYAAGAKEGAKSAHDGYIDGGCWAGQTIMDNLYEAEDSMSGDDADGAWVDGYLNAVHKEAFAHGCPRIAYQY